MNRWRPAGNMLKNTTQISTLWCVPSLLFWFSIASAVWNDTMEQLWSVWTNKGGVKASLRCGGTAGSLCEKGSSFSVQSCLLPLSNLCDQNTYHPLCSVCFLPGRMYGADDFLPMLTYVVAQCDMPQLDTEIQYMMELLDPSLLQGEGRSCRFDPWSPGYI